MKPVGNKGETLIEIIFSLAVLSVVVAAAAMVITASTKIISTNIDGRNSLQQEVEALAQNQNLETIESKTIQYSYSVGEDNYNDSFTVDKVRVMGRSLQKYQ